MLISSEHDAVTSVKRSLSIELEAVPTGSEQAKTIDELGTALLTRASLDDEVGRRRLQRFTELHALTTTVLPEAPTEIDQLLHALSAHADALSKQALSKPQVAEVLREIAAVLIETELPEVRPRRPESTTHDESTAYRAAIRPSVTEEQLLTCLRKQVSSDITIHRITNLHTLSGGFSKEMLAATVEHSRGTDDIVIRKVAQGRTADTLSGEFAALTFAWQGGVPTAEPLWLDERSLGTPAFATRKAIGRCLGDVWGPAESIDRDTGRSIATALARLHSLDTTKLPGTPLPPMITRAEITAAIDERRNVLSTVSTPSSPYAVLFALTLGWLRARTPDDVRNPVLVHGDFGLHNLLIEGTELTAVLDWERSHLGHAAEDLTYLRPSIEPILGWEEFLEEYQAAGGEPPDTDRLTFYTVWHDVWRGISSYRMRAKFLADPNKISDAMAGLLMSPRFLLRAVRTAFHL